MAVTLTPNIQATTPSAPSAPATGLVFQSGQVITAKVLQVLGGNQVQIAIGNQTIEAATQVPLQVGQTLQLQVSQTANGIGLAIVNQPGSAAPGQAGGAAAPTSDPVLTLSPSLAATLATNLTPNAVSATNSLTPLETLAVSIAAETAATQQTSLAPLFADLNAASSLPNLPPQVQQSVAQVLAQQTNLDQNLTADAVKQAFQTSGLFLEASLASGAASASSGAPDLKAALIVLRQALTSALSDPTLSTGAPSPALASTPQSGATPAATTADEAAPSGLGLPVTASLTGTSQQGAALSAAALAQASDIVTQADASPAAIVAEEILTSAPSIVPPSGATMASASTSAAASLPEVFEMTAGGQNLAATATLADAAARAAASSAALNVLQEVLQASPLAVINPLQFLTENAQAFALLPALAGVRTPDDAEFARTDLPPPPIGGALPAAQPVAPATLSPHMPLNATLQHLLDDTDGAIARQTLLQIASLPGQADASATRTDPTAPRWNFEIPFATPQGTAMAQFEISRDGGGREAAAAKATWRARFSLNVEPAGPVHALISLNGDRTSVRMWAERSTTASQLRAGVSELSQALSRAELTPGDIVVRDGAPPQPAAAVAGHFLDRAS